MNCNQENMLIARCQFDVNLEDASGSATGIIMDKEGEKLLSLTAEEIYDLALAGVNQLPFAITFGFFGGTKLFCRKINSLIKLALPFCFTPGCSDDNTVMKQDVLQLFVSLRQLKTIKNRKQAYNSRKIAWQNSNSYHDGLTTPY